MKQNLPENENVPMSGSETDRDELLVSLLERLTRCAADRRTEDLDQLIQEHPDLSAELRELWTTAQVVAEMAGSQSAESDHDAATISSGDVGLGSNTVPRDGQPGRVGDYDPLAELGRGGMGVVYRARQRSLGRIVALKMVLRGSLASDTDLARFRTEAQSAARLHHPHIVPVYEVGEADGQPYFSMKYIEGTTLARRLADGPLSGREAAELLLPVCRAIADAHRHGVLHRDLKPSNILIDRAGRPYVSDFGLAKRVCPMEADLPADGGVTFSAAVTQSGAVLGTPAYMAPEQAAGRRGLIGPAADVYGLGALLYAMITGRPPFQAASPVDTILMVLEQDPVPPRVINPKADADLELIALKCLQKPAELRYASADGLADDLEAYLANEPISARSSHFSQILSRAFGETHHAPVLENWGVLWMWHSLVLLVLCLMTNAFQLLGVTSRLPYLGLWVVGLGLWAAIFWNLRRRSGPITFVERQIAHVWAGSMIASTLLYWVEWLLDLPVLKLSPILGLVTGAVFLVKAGILTGRFYVQAVALFATALVMASLANSDWPNFGLTVFGLVSAACFFVPGLKYYRQRVHATEGRNPD